eukprot:1870652-Prymnesium_polylepis.1
MSRVLRVYHGWNGGGSASRVTDAPSCLIPTQPTPPLRRCALAPSPCGPATPTTAPTATRGSRARSHCAQASAAAGRARSGRAPCASSPGLRPGSRCTRVSGCHEVGSRAG